MESPSQDTALLEKPVSIPCDLRSRYFFCVWAAGRWAAAGRRRTGPGCRPSSLSFATMSGCWPETSFFSDIGRDVVQLGFDGLQRVSLSHVLPDCFQSPTRIVCGRRSWKFAVEERTRRPASCRVVSAG